jgi:ubiquinone/menaquinone biosynthesis C-methylase UbiE
METQTRFDDYVDLYDKYRLKYNTDVLNKTISFIKHIKNDIKTIADIGAGTGILTHQLLKYKLNTFALEPNKLMQDRSNKKDTKKKIIHINKSSTKTTLKKSSIDIIFVGTAIHWFEPKETLKEFKRILKKNSFLVILSGGYSGKIGQEIHDMYQKYKLNSNKVVTRYKKGMINYSNEYHTIISRKPINLTMEQFVGLEMSMSTAPKKDNKIYKSYVYDLQKIFKKYSKNNKLTIVNKTTALISNKLLKKSI